MPRAKASRGERNTTASPSTAIVPSSGRSSPDRILISVDLPAPLSPRRQTTSPGLTSRLTSRIAITLPKYFDTARASMTGGRLLPSGTGSIPLHVAAGVAVDEHGRQEHQA